MIVLDRSIQFSYHFFPLKVIQLTYLNNPSSCYRILVVDDQPDNLFLLQSFLELFGYEVETANTGEVALLKVQRSPPDLMLLDVMMPGMDGLEVVRHLRQHDHSSSIPVVLVTASQEMTSEDAIAVGASGLILKPIDLTALLEAVKIWCEEFP